MVKNVSDSNTGSYAEEKLAICLLLEKRPQTINPWSLQDLTETFSTGTITKLG